MGTKYQKSKQMLLDYGWPDAFRKDNFNRDIDGMQAQWKEEDHQAGRKKIAAEYAALQMEELALKEATEGGQ